VGGSRYYSTNAPLGLPPSVVEVELVVGTTVVVLDVVTGAVVGVGELVDVVGVGLLVVVGAAVVVEPPHAPSHASQQLSAVPTQAIVLPDDWHLSAFFLIEHFTLPFLSTRQQVTESGLPQVDLAAHDVTSPLQLAGSVPASTRAFATSFTQLTYWP
jgi:hypothetical protein